MKFPGPQFCGDSRDLLMVVGKIPSDSEEAPQIVFLGNGTDEAFHVRIDVDSKFVERWASSQNVTVARMGEPGDGISIDRDEPFVLM